MKGIIYVLLASLLFGIIPSINKFVLDQGCSSTAILLTGSIVTGILSLVFAVQQKESLRIPFVQGAELFLIGIVGQGGTSLLLLLSYNYIPVGISTFLHFFYPTIVCLITAFVFHEGMTLQKTAAIIVSAAGMLLIAGNMKLSGGSAGIFLAVASSFAYAFYMISSGKWQVSVLSCHVRLFYTSIGCTLFFLIVFLTGVGSRAASFSMLNREGVLLLVINAVLSFLAHLFINKGINLLGASKTAFINLLEPVTSLIVSSILFHTRVTSGNLAGCLLILSSVVLITGIYHI